MDGEKNMSDKAATQSEVDRLRNQIQELKADLQELGVLAQSAAREKLHQAEGAVHGYFDEGRERYEEYEDRITDHIREKPFQSVLTAFGIGMLASILLRR